MHWRTSSPYALPVIGKATEVDFQASESMSIVQAWHLRGLQLKPTELVFGFVTAVQFQGSVARGKS
jgi:hypothetical protein